MRRVVRTENWGLRATLAAGGAAVMLVATSGTTSAAGTGGTQVERPFKGTGVGQSFVAEPCDESEFPVVVCEVTTVGGGNITHLGRVSSRGTGIIAIDFSKDPCVLPDGSATGVVIESSGTFVYVAANGDEVFASYDDTLCSAFGESAGSLQGTQTITGGTGRFEGASGGTMTNGTVDDPAPNTFEIDSVGTITY